MSLRRATIVASTALATALLVLATAVAVLYLVQRDRVLPNTSIARIDVGSMTSDDLRATLDALASHRQDHETVYTFEDQRLVLHPDDVAYRLDVDASVATVLARGRTGVPGEVLERVRSLWTHRDLALVESWDDGLVAGWVAEAAEQIDRPVFHGDVRVDPDTRQVRVDLPHGRAQLLRVEAHEAIVAALVEPTTDEQALPVDTSDALVDADDVRAVAEQARRAVAAPVVLVHELGTIRLTQSDLARLVGLERAVDGDRQTVELRVTPGRLRHVIDPQTAASFASEAVDARFRVEREPPVTFDEQGPATFEPFPVDIGIDPGRPGTRFDHTLAAGQLTEMLRDGQRRAALRVAEIEPDVPEVLAVDQRPTHLLGTFTTYHPAGQSRVHNIQRLADTIDGTIVLPGEQFSINGISGRRTCEGGYVPAGTIVAGELVDTCGGGTSQFGTTTFNAAFFAGVQLDQWKAHSWYISRYPMGREATINYPELDVKFTNDTGSLILVKTSHSPSSITVSLYGRPTATSVTATRSSPTNPRPPSTQVRQTNDLYVDQERVIQSAGAGGFSVRVERIIERIDGTTETQTINTTYLPQHRIVERGTRPRPD